MLDFDHFDIFYHFFYPFRVSASIAVCCGICFVVVFVCRCVFVCRHRVLLYLRSVPVILCNSQAKRETN